MALPKRRRTGKIIPKPMKRDLTATEFFNLVRTNPKSAIDYCDARIRIESAKHEGEEMVEYWTTIRERIRRGESI